MLALLAAAAALLAAFVAAERRVRDPLLPLDLLRDRAFTGVQLAAFAIAAWGAIFLAAAVAREGLLAGLNGVLALGGVLALAGAVATLWLLPPGALREGLTSERRSGFPSM
jgi:hypothetical protein